MLQTNLRFVWAGIVALGLVCPDGTMAQEKVVVPPTAKATGKPVAALRKESAAGDTRAAVGVAEKLVFEQAKARTQTAELEERMFRLAEALKTLEPENSSRLRTALKLAREELIAQQMKDTEQLLARLKLDDASTEIKQLQHKLQRLHDMLLATDLDFQMQLEKMRQLRELLRKLEEVVKEEDRERRQSDATAQRQDELAKLHKRRKSLEQLARAQRGHRAAAEQLVKTAAAAKSAGEQQLAAAQTKTQRDTKALNDEWAKTGHQSSNLEVAQSAMRAAAAALAKADAQTALPQQNQALAALEKELQRQNDAARELNQRSSAELFRTMQRDQSATRQRTDGLAQGAKQLGDSGANAADALGKAGSAMSSAEHDLQGEQARPAAKNQLAALNELKKAREQLGDELEKLLNSMQGEIRRRVVENLTLMLEKQKQIREATQALAPGVKRQSRQALAAAVALGSDEGQLMQAADELINLVEETEFGVALPAALRVVNRQMAWVKTGLGAADCSADMIACQMRIESDLQQLLAAMKRMPATRPPKNFKSQSPDDEDRERELNRLIAELKMIRMIQVRVNGDTKEIHQRRQAEAARLSEQVRQQIHKVGGDQDGVRQTTDKLIERVLGPRDL